MEQRLKAHSAQFNFWFAWVPLSVAGFAVIYLAFYLLYQFQVEKQDEQIGSAFRLTTSQIYEDFNTAIADLRFIADNPVTHNFLADPHLANQKMVAELFLSMSASHKRYDQMRLLSPEGQEEVRVNFNRGRPVSVPPAQLQNKSGRYYFRESLALQPGEVFVSQFDLNVENGVVEQPVKPTIRFSMPLYDGAGQVTAVVVLNYFGDGILNSLSNSFRGQAGRVMLLNNDGYWLYDSSHYVKLWGFMYGRKDGFFTRYPEIWRQLQLAEQGAFESDQGRVNFISLNISAGQQKSRSERRLKPWKLVVITAENQLGLNFFQKHLAYLYPLLIAYPLGSVLLWYWARASAGRSRAEEELRQLNHLLEEKVMRRTEELEATREATILSLATLAETRDNETGQHIRRTQRYARVLANRLKHHPDFAELLTDKLVLQIFRSAPLHDIGKVGIPDSILHKPERLSAEEFEVMKTHTTLGSNAIEEAINTLSHRSGQNGEMTFLHCARDIAHYHHEKWDGSGYPKGLSGEAIPLTARIMALVDVYDALVSKRVYKEAYSREKAEHILLHQSPGQFDPRVVEAFRAVADEFWQIRLNFSDSALPAEQKRS